MSKRIKFKDNSGMTLPELLLVIILFIYFAFVYLSISKFTAKFFYRPENSGLSSDGYLIDYFKEKSWTLLGFRLFPKMRSNPVQNNYSVPVTNFTSHY